MTAGPRHWPLVGVLVPFSRDPMGFLERNARFGDVVRFRNVGTDLWQLNHPALVHEVMHEQFASTDKWAVYELLRPMLGDGLITAGHDTWQRHRKLMAPPLTRRRVATYADTMVRCVVEHVEALRPGEVREWTEDMMLLSRRILVRTLFGTDEPPDVARAAGCLDVLMKEFQSEAQGIRRVLPRRMPTPGRRRLARTAAVWHEALDRIVAARRGAPPGDDLLWMLLEARDEAGGGLDDDEVRDEVATLFLAGHETTALALTWAQTQLSAHPEARRRLQEEVDGVLGDGLPSFEDVARLPYTRAVFQEVLRLRPPVWVFGRRALAELRAGEHRIPAGSQAIAVPWVLHRDPRWFHEPESFRPERWLDGLEERLPRCAYIPFGVQPRRCVGNHFAMLSGVLVLATLAARVRIDLLEPEPAPLPTVTLRPAGPVRARVTLR